MALACLIHSNIVDATECFQYTKHEKYCVNDADQGVSVSQVSVTQCAEICNSWAAC